MAFYKINGNKNSKLSNDEKFIIKKIFRNQAISKRRFLRMCSVQILML